MTETSNMPIPERKMRLVWPVLAMVAAALIAYPGLQAFVRGGSVEEWIVDVVLALLLLVLYFGIKLGAWLEGDRTAADQFGLTGWITLAVCILWVVVGGVFLATVRSSIDVIGFTIFGAIGGVAMLIQLYRMQTAPA